MEVAKSLARLFDEDYNKVVGAAMDRSTNIDGAFNTIAKAWTVDLLARQASPEYLAQEGKHAYNPDDDIQVATTLDLFTVLAHYQQRAATDDVGFKILEYSARRPKTHDANTRRIDDAAIEGHFDAIVSNAKTHAFNFQIYDMSIEVTQPDGSVTMGHPMNYAVATDSGDLHQGIVFSFGANEDELKYLANNGVLTDDGIAFSKFINQQLRAAFVGSRYLSTVVLEARITDEIRHFSSLYRGWEKELADLTVKEGEPKPDVRSYGKAEQEEIPRCLEAKLYVNMGDKVVELEKVFKDDMVQGSYSEPSIDVGEISVIMMDEGLTQKQAELTGKIRSARARATQLRGYQTFLRARTRAVELAYRDNGTYEDGRIKQTGWAFGEYIQNTDFKTLLGGGRLSTVWDGIVHVGGEDVAREYYLVNRLKTEKVNRRPE